ncbi:MAG: Zn-dependent hydrolase [Proteobacteria bacterium]|nr:Zn-dependent hydrolase [Pseudomonadota bacterium]
MVDRYAHPARWLTTGILLLSVLVARAGAETGPVDVAAEVAKFREVHMRFDATALTPRQRAMVTKLAEATRLLDELYWEQADPVGLRLYRSLAASKTAADANLRRLVRIMGGRYDLIAEFAPFGGAGPKPPGNALYPPDLTREEIDGYLAHHPERRGAIFDPLTVVRRDGKELVAVPYHVAYARWLAPMAEALRAAAALSDDAAFARYLRLRADALLSDDYFASDIAWLELERPPVDLIFAPYETYFDGLLGVKASYGAAILIRDDVESRKVEAYQEFVPQIQDALPLPAEDRPSKHGHVSPMEVMDTPLRGGDLRHGYQAVADNLPNDPRVHEQKGSKKLFFKNFMDARVNEVILPLARRLLDPAQTLLATADGYLTTTVMHEIAHELGPLFSRTREGKRDIREAIGPEFSALEEAKADIVGLYGLAWLADHGHYPAAKLDECYVSEIAGIFRTVRFGVAEAHGRGEIMEFNYFSERGAVHLDAASGRYRVDTASMRGAVASLARELLEQEASGDRERVHRWFEKYGSMPAPLAAALAKTGDVPVDVDPSSDFPEL